MAKKLARSQRNLETQVSLYFIQLLEGIVVVGWVQTTYYTATHTHTHPRPLLLFLLRLPSKGIRQLYERRGILPVAGGACSTCAETLIGEEGEDFSSFPSLSLEFPAAEKEAFSAKRKKR